MGCQGEIYNVYGIIVPAKIKSNIYGDVVGEIVPDKTKSSNPPHNRRGYDSPVVYEIAGKLVSHDELADNIDFEAGIPTVGVDLEKPELVIKVLGHDTWGGMGSRHFEGNALLGYVVANASYINSAEPVPDFSEIKKLNKQLIKEISQKFDLKVAERDLKLHLVFDSLNGI